MNNFTTETSGTSTYLVYKKEPEKELDTLSLGMLVNNKISHVLPILFTQIDSDKYLKYNISSRIPLSQYFGGIVNKQRLLTVFSGILKGIINATEYMIEPGSFLLDTQSVYVDVTSGRSYLICLPLMELADQKLDLCTFFKNIIFSTQFDQSENTAYVVQLISYLNSYPNLSAGEFLQFIDEMLYGKVQRPQENGQNSQQLPNRAAPQPQAAANTNQYVTPQSNSPQVLNSANNPNTAASQTSRSTPAVKAEPKKEGQKPEQKPPYVHGFAIPGGGIKETGNKKKEEKKPDNKPEKKEKEHKGFCFFGKKKADKENNPAQNNTGYVIPGAPINNRTNQSVQNQPVSNGVVQSINVPNTNPPTVNGAPKMNFGETTVLGGGSFGETTVLGANTQPSQAALIRKKNNERIIINKDVFKIGKERSFVDYFIGDNSAISRSHANIIKKGEDYFITDTNSTNHTYVNGVMLQPGSEQKLQSGDTVKLANEEFRFTL